MLPQKQAEEAIVSNLTEMELETREEEKDAGRMHERMFPVEARDLDQVS